MKIEQVKEIANAVLYEGYLLYPYRHSAIKNRQRWTIGVVYPREYSEANGGIEPWTMHTECLVRGNTDTSIDIYVRFLHLLLRTEVQKVQSDTHVVGSSDSSDASGWSYARLAHEPQEEGVEREVTALHLSLAELVQRPRLLEIEFPAEHWQEDARDNATITVVRGQQPLLGVALLTAEMIDTQLFKLSVHIENRTPGTAGVTNRHNAVLHQSFVSTHTLLQVHEGNFISLLEPPETLHPVAQECRNLRTWPVLVGDQGETNAMLSSPIILYDYPQIAPESPGPLFDGTEIDEILTLRIMTLTDEEKEEMRRDERTREILERTESLTPEQFMKLHGTIRSLRPIDEGA